MRSVRVGKGVRWRREWDEGDDEDEVKGIDEGERGGGGGDGMVAEGNEEC